MGAFLKDMESEMAQISHSPSLPPLLPPSPSQEELQKDPKKMEAFLKHIISTR